MNSLKVSIIIPTRNESENIVRLISMVKQYGHEIIVVDDSDDNTPELARNSGAVVIKGRRKGLGRAILDGIYASNKDVVLVMDSDLSHSPKYIPDLLKPILEQGYDMTIGSRYTNGGSVSGWTLKRRIISRVASMMAYPITWIKDNTSGFFAFRKEITKNVKLNPSSWKIMLEVLIKAKPVAVKEVPICFTDRVKGKSKFNKKEVSNYLKHLTELALLKYSAIIKFGIIGVIGAVIHFLALYTLTDLVHLWYILSAVLSIVLASTSNYILNHKITFQDRQVSNHILGWFKYQIMSAVTDGIYLLLLALFVEVFGIWYMAGAALSVCLVFPVKFIVATTLIWSRRINPNQSDYEWVAFYRGNLIQKWWKLKIAETVWSWIPDASRILDIGCGSSPVIVKYGKNGIGFDTNRGKLNYMMKRSPDSLFTNVIPAIKYDHILCLEVLEHLSDAESMVKTISGLIVDGGTVIIATPDYDKILWHIAERFTPYQGEHITRFNKDTLEALCLKYRMKPLRYKYVATCDLIEMFYKEYDVKR